MLMKFNSDSALFSFAISQNLVSIAQRSIYSGSGERSYTDKTLIQKTSNSSCHDLEKTIELFNSIYEDKSFIDAILQELSELKNVVSSNLTVSFARNIRKYIVLGKTEMHDATTVTLNLNVIFSFSQQMVRCNREEHFVFKKAKQIVLAVQKMVMSINNSYSEAPKLSFIDKNIVTKLEHIIVPSGRGGIIIHETLGHMLEADNFFEINNPLYQHMNKRISSFPLNVVDDSCESLIGNLADDGTKKNSCNLVHNGILCGVLSDKFYSNKYGINNTGNARVDRYPHLPLPRMCRTYLEANSAESDNLLERVNNGVLINEILGGSCDVSTGTFSFNITHAYLIKNGQKVAQLHPFTLIANISSFLQNIICVGNDLGFYSSVCNKKGQMLRVIYGTPTLIVETKKLEVTYGL